MPGFVPPGGRRQGFEFRAANECPFEQRNLAGERCETFYIVGEYLRWARGHPEAGKWVCGLGLFLQAVSQGKDAGRVTADQGAMFQNLLL
jgi:hypothetical protein